MSQIKTTKGPNLTPPTNDYNINQQLQTLNQLRLYFNEIDSTNAAMRNNIYSLNTLMWLGDI